MKTYNYLIVIFSAAFLLVVSINNVNATHAMGGELTVTPIAGTTYKVKLRFWRFVSGISAPTTISLNIGSTTNPSITASTATMTRDTIYLFSPNLIQEAVYSTTVVLPDSLATYLFYAREFARNTGIINIPNSNVTAMT